MVGEVEAFNGSAMQSSPSPRSFMVGEVEAFNGGVMQSSPSPSRWSGFKSPKIKKKEKEKEKIKNI